MLPPGETIRHLPDGTSSLRNKNRNSINYTQKHSDSWLDLNNLTISSGNVFETAGGLRKILLRDVE